MVHFTTQFGPFKTDIPSIFQPHDLQHLHLPEFFTAEEIDAREQRYRAASDQAAMVSVMSLWGRDDVIRHYGLNADRVRVVPWAPVLESYPVPAAEDMRQLRAQFNLPEDFLLYPAQTWPHKNHLALLRAVARLRDERICQVNVVCTGRPNDHYARVREEIDRLRLHDQIRFTGFVEPWAMRGLYRLARALVFPSLFEGWGMPILEAFAEGLPVCCSNITMLPALAGGAALLFDPRDEEALGGQIERVWEDANLRSNLKAAGTARAAEFSWTKTARLLTAHYRRLAGSAVSTDDQRLIETAALV